MLDNAVQDEQNPIEILWTNAYCEKDNILKYLLKICMPKIDPIGLSPIISEFSENSRKEKTKLDGQPQEDNMRKNK